jgi:hypothetical protein
MPQDGYGYDKIEIDSFLPINTFDFLINNDNIKDENKNILEKKEHEIICYTYKGLDQSLWDWGINHCQDFADHARHDCDPGMHNNSKDDDTVSALYNVLDNAYGIRYLANIFRNYYFENNNINNQKSRIVNKIHYYNSIIPFLDSSCKKIKAENKERIIILQNIKKDAESNKNILNSNSGILDNNYALNNNYSNYLQTRIDIPKEVSTNNFEELYKAVILQNNTFQNTIDKVNDNIILDNKKSGFVSEKKSFVYSIYLKLFLFYYILVIVFIFFLIFIEKEWSYYKKIIISIISFIFPIMLFYIETIIFNIWLYISSIFSSSIYTYSDLV